MGGHRWDEVSGLGIVSGWGPIIEVAAAAASDRGIGDGTQVSGLRVDTWTSVRIDSVGGPAGFVGGLPGSGLGRSLVAGWDPITAVAALDSDVGLRLLLVARKSGSVGGPACFVGGLLRIEVLGDGFVPEVVSAASASGLGLGLGATDALRRSCCLSGVDWWQREAAESDDDGGDELAAASDSAIAARLTSSEHRPTLRSMSAPTSAHHTQRHVYRKHGFTPKPVNQKEAQGEEAGRGIANGSARQRRRRGEMYSDSAYRVAEETRNDEGR